MKNTIIDMIRHGEPVGGSRYRGHTIDDPLSDKGWQQMWEAVDGYKQWEVVVSSPMLRCSEFATKIGERLTLPVVIDERIKEIGFGVWEGKTREQLQKEDLEQYLSFYRDPVQCRPEGAEDLNEFIARTTSAYQDIVHEFTGRHVLCVTHAGVMRAIITHVLHAAPLGMYKIKINNAGITRIRVSDDGGILEFINQSIRG